MRKIILFIAFACSGALVAQNFTIKPSLTHTANQTLNTYADYTFYIKNNKASILNMSWDLVSDNFITGWDYSICDFGTCYIKPFPASGTMAPISVADSGYMKMTLGTATFAGNGVFKIYIYETGNKAGGDTLTWDITAGSTGFANYLDEDKAVKFYPNPVKDKAVVAFSNIEKQKELLVYNSTGSLAKKVSVDSGVSNTEMDLTELSAGTYFLMVSEEHSSYIKKFVVQ